MLPCFCNPLRPIPNLTTCSSSPAVREPISVVIPSDLLRKKDNWCKRLMLVIVWQRWARWRERDSYPAFIVWGRNIECKTFVMRCQCRWKEKSDEEAKKEQGKALTEKWIFVAKSGVENKIFLANPCSCHRLWLYMKADSNYRLRHSDFIKHQRVPAMKACRSPSVSKSSKFDARHQCPDFLFRSKTQTTEDEPLRPSSIHFFVVQHIFKPINWKSI
jgi:hypothetical protein